MPEIYDTIIIGGGVTGFGAAMYAGRFEMKTLLLGDTMGGVIITTNEVANYPGFSLITGMELAEKLKQHALEYKVKMLEKKVEEVRKAADGFVAVTVSEQFSGKTIIFATGTEWKKLKVPGEKEFANKGVHYCALCDGAFYKGKIVALVGGSDSAAKDALVLAEYAKKVYIVYRGEKIRPEPVNLRRVEANQKIEVISKANVLRIKGERFVKAITLDREFHGSQDLPVDGVFIAIGHLPLSSLAKRIGVTVNNKDEIIIDRHGFTNVEGVFAAGDVVDTEFKQAITGVAEGVTAAYNAYNYLQKAKVMPS